MNQPRGRYYSDEGMGDFRRVWGNLEDGKKMFAAQLIIALCGPKLKADDDIIEEATKVVEQLGSDRRKELIHAIAEWIEPTATQAEALSAVH